MFVPRKKSPQARLSRERYREAIKVHGGGPRLDLGGAPAPSGAIQFQRRSVGPLVHDFSCDLVRLSYRSFFPSRPVPILCVTREEEIRFQPGEREGGGPIKILVSRRERGSHSRRPSSGGEEKYCTYSCAQCAVGRLVENALKSVWFVQHGYFSMNLPLMKHLKVGFPYLNLGFLCLPNIRE